MYECKRCETVTNEYGLFTVGPRIDEQSETFGSYETHQSRKIEMTDSPLDSGYCRECAEKRQRELRRSDERSRLQKRFKANGAENLHADDCTVVAIANTTGVQYAEALAISKRAGYRPNRGGVYVGTWLRSLQIAAKRKGRVVEPVSIGDCGRLTVEKFAATMPKGRYVIRVTGHAISIKNGKIFNASAADRRRIVAGAFRVRKADPSSVVDRLVLDGVPGGRR